MSRSKIALALFTLLIGACGGSEASGTDEDTGAGGADTSGGGGDTSITPTDVGGHDGTSGDGTVIDGGTTDSSVGETNPGDGGIACGTATCDPATQTCCVEFSGGGATAKCIDKGGACGGGTLDCTNSAACPTGDVCCGSRDPTGGFGATCTTASDCSSSGGTQLCATDAECPTGERCRNAFGGIKVCRAGGGFDGGGFDGSGFDTSGFDTSGFGG